MFTETIKPTRLLEEPDVKTIPHPVTPFTIMLVMAYLHNYTPNRLPDSRLLAAKHLRLLAKLISQPDEQLRSVRQHQSLASHLTLLQAASFLHDSSNQLALQPTVTNWLHYSPQARIKPFLKIIEDTAKWSQTLCQMNLQDTITEDYTLYLRQSLARQLQTLPIIEEEQPVFWQNESEQDVWQLTMPRCLPLWLQFDLRQLGDWVQDSVLTCTPLSIATAVQRGYGPETIQWLLETATHKKLPEAKGIQLRQWSRRAHAYQLRTVHLLTVAQDQQLASVLRRKQLRRAVIEQISPRHAVVYHNIAPRLEKHLAKKNYLLNHTLNQTEQPIETGSAAAWLATRILIKLGQLTPLPCPPPHTLLEQLESHLEAAQKTELEAMADTFIQNIRDALHGRDAFFPAQQSPSPQLIKQIECAIQKQNRLSIHYRALTAPEPKQHIIEPHRLEKRGQLYYLHAYSTRAEANLTFRLDRILLLEDLT